MKTFRLVVLPGDGVGPEVIASAVRVLRAAERGMKDAGFSVEEYPCGAEEFARSGMAMRPRTWKSILRADAILAGPMGLPGIRDHAGLEIEPLYDVRERLSLDIRICPARKFSPEGLDVAIVGGGDPGRACRVAFERAGRRRRQVTLVAEGESDLARVFDEVAASFPGCTTGRSEPDGMDWNRKDLDIVVAEEGLVEGLHAGALELSGGPSLGASAHLGEKHALYQPLHGSSPGGAADPTGAITAVWMLLDGLDHPEARMAAKRVAGALERVPPGEVVSALAS